MAKRRTTSGPPSQPTMSTAERFAGDPTQNTISPQKGILTDQRAKQYYNWILASIRFQDKMLLRNLKRLRKAYESGADKVFGAGLNVSHEVRVPVIFPATEAKVAAIYPKNPDIRVRPRRRTFQIDRSPLPPMEIDGEDASKRIKTLVDYDVRAINIKDEIAMALVDADIVGYGAVECGWDVWTEREENKAEEAKGTAKPTGEDMADAKVELSVGSERFNQKLDLRWDQRIRKEQPWAKRLMSEAVLFPPFARNISDVPWMVVRKRRLSEEVKADPRYVLPEDFDEHATYLSQDIMAKDIEQQVDVDSGLMYGITEEYHFWSKIDRVYAIYIGSMASPVYVEKWPYAAEGFPIKLIYFHFNPTALYPISPAALTLNQQNEKNLIRTRMANHIDRWQSKVLVDSTVSEEEMERFRTAPDGGLVAVEDVRKWVPIQPTPMPPEWLLYDQTTDRDIYNISGVNEYQRGGAGGARFATEAVLIQQNAATKVDAKKDKVRDFFIEIVTYLFQLRQQFMTKSVEISITGEEGFTYHQINPDMIGGEYEFEIDVESSAATDRQRDAENAKILVDLLYGKPETVPEAVLNRAAKLLNIPSRQELIKPVENFEAMRAAEYEDTLMMMGQPVRVDPKEDAKAHLLVHNQSLTGMKDMLASGQIADPRRAQLAQVGLQHLQQHIVETAALIDQTGQLATALAQSQAPGQQPGGRLRTDVRKPGAGQGAQPYRGDTIRGRQRSNAQQPGTGTAFETKVERATGGGM